MRSIVLLLSCLIAQQLLAEESCQRAPDPSRIAIAGGSITEVLYFLGEEERIVAVDRTSNFPQAALDLPQIGYVRGLSTEGLLSLKPTLVLGEDDMGPPEVLAQLTQTGIDTVRVKEVHTAQGILNKVRCVANVLSLENAELVAAEARLVSQLNALESVTVSKQSPTAILVLMFQEGAAIAGGENTSADGMLRMAGIKNALVDVKGWKPLSAESLIKANPDYLILTDRAVSAAGGLDKVYQNPGVRLTNAGKYQHLVQMDGMSMLGFGPRTLSAALRLSEITQEK